MEKIYILGNKKNNNKFLSIPQAKCEILPDMIVDDCAINDYLVKTFPKDIDKLILYIDETPELVMAIAMHLRLSIFSLKYKSLIPILFVSELSEDSYLHVGVYSQILLTDGIYFCEPNQVAVNISHIKMLTPDKYKSGFVDRISIKPNASVGRHSIANQWGASVLGEVSGLDEKLYSEAVLMAKKSLYFKYVYVSSFDNIEELLSPRNEVLNKSIAHLNLPIKGKYKILLIDDQSENGWFEVLDNILKKCAKLDCISEKVSDYSDFSAGNKEKIEKGEYDLFFLDLRLNGGEEENISNPEDFSGMKVLKKIKELNRGNQVIMLTASSKSWNLKALMDAGCDGYYAKESPEYKFSRDFSIKNFENLEYSINQCLRKTYLRDIYKKIEKIKLELGPEDDNDDGYILNCIYRQLDIAFYLLTLAKTKVHYAHSFFSLYQVVELILETYLRLDGGEYKLQNGGDVNEVAYCWFDDTGKVFVKSPNIVLKAKASVYQRFMAFYIQYLHGSKFSKSDENFISKVGDIIKSRNIYVHQQDFSKTATYYEDNFLNLFKAIYSICEQWAKIAE